MKETDIAYHWATKTNSKQDAACIRQLNQVWKDPKRKSKQTDAYIRYFHEALEDIETKSEQTAAYIR